MKRLPLILTATIFGLTIGGYLLYTKLLVKSVQDPWGLIPESSVLVYESGNCTECVESVKQSPLWNIVQKISMYSKPSDSLKNVFNFLNDRPYKLLSLHITKKDDFDFIFYTPADQKKFDATLDYWKKNKVYKFSEREFNSIKIQEVVYDKHVFSWVILDNIWVGSFTSFLIEDVIRVYKAENEQSFKKRMDVSQLPKLKNDAGNVFIHLRNFSNWSRIFTEGTASTLLQNFGKSSVLSVKTSDGNFSLTGLSSDSLHKPDYTLSIFANQTPAPFNQKQLISNRTVVLTTYGISDGESFRKDLMNFSGRRPALNDTLAKFSKSLNFNVNPVFKNINGEIGVCLVESKGQELSKILLIETHQPKVWEDALTNLSEKLSTDTVFYEKFSDYEIRELPLYRFPEKILWPLVSGFDRTYYAFSGNTVLLAEDLEELKKYLDDIDKEETWGKSVSQNKFLESTLLEANISFYINTPRIWNILLGSVNLKWKPFIMENHALLQSLGMGAVQFSHLNESFYTNVSWKYDRVVKTTKGPSNDQRMISNFSEPIGKMMVVKNHVDKRDEVLVQDSAYTLRLISSKGKVLWEVALESMIKGDVEQIDYFNNGKLQYFFATSTKLHIIDRLGNYVKPFPVTISVKDIEYVSVVDYDHSRKYRFLVASKSGKLWMYDKEGNNLEGWTPKNIEEGLITAPRHHRIRGKDYIIAIRKDGKIYLLNRRGETLKKFPLDLETKPQGDYFLETGSDLSNTYFVVVSRDGYRIKFNLEGKIQSRETLLKNAVDAQFSLIRERSGKSYLMLREESKRLTLMDESGKELITNDYVGKDPVNIEYTDFGAGKIFIIITDTHQGLSFVYTKQGNLLTTPPVESYFASIRPDDNALILFTAYHKVLTIQPLP